YGERIVHAKTRTGNSGHYYIDRDGAIYQYVDDDRIAHHVREHNPHTIGIELVNTGRYPEWYRSDNQIMTEPYPPAQVDSLVQLVGELRVRYPTISAIAGHEDLDRETLAAEDNPAVTIRRKVDPGPLFPWDAVLGLTGLARLGLAP
ncbi:MAG: N-acetylmuramoyl-L-alanine amidase, partial [Pseudomonadota bacterium]